MDEGRRSRVSLGVSSVSEKENGLAPPVARKRAMSIAGSRVVSPRSQARRSLVPRKSILKQHVPVPVIADDDQAPAVGTVEPGTQDFEQSISDAPSSLRGSRKSEGGRRVSFAANAQVRLFDKQQGSPSPAATSPPNRASFASDQEPALSPIKRRSVSLARRRSSLLASSPYREPETVVSPPKPAPIPFPLNTNGVEGYEDDDSDMDIDDPVDEPLEAADDSYMSIAATEFNPSPTRQSQVGGVDMTGSPSRNSPLRLRGRVSEVPSDMTMTSLAPDLSPSRRQSLVLDADNSDMSIAVTTYPGSGRESLATNVDEANAFAGPSSLQVGSHDELPVSHEFVVPLGRHIPRTDSDGNVLSPSPAEKAKAAALKSLGQFSRESGGDADQDEEDEEDEDEGPVVPIRIRNDMSIEDASQRIRAASEGLDFDDGGDQTMSTVSSESTGDITGGNPPEATINIAAMRKSLQPTVDTAEPPAPFVPESNAFPTFPPSKSSEPPAPRPAAVFTVATPTRSTSVPPRSSAKPPSFSAAFAPSVVTPRKRALSAPSPSPSPTKKRAIGPGPTLGLSPSKPTKVMPINIFQASPVKQPAPDLAPSKSSIPRPASPAKVSKPAPTLAPPPIRNPFLEPTSSQSITQVGHAPSSANSNVTAARKDHAKSVTSNTRLSVGPRPSLTIAGSASSSLSSSITSIPTEQAPRRRVSNIFRNRRSSVVPPPKNPSAPSEENTLVHATSKSASGPSGINVQPAGSQSRPQSPAPSHSGRARSRSCDRETQRQAAAMPSPTRGSPSPASNAFGKSLSGRRLSLALGSTGRRMSISTEAPNDAGASHNPFLDTDPKGTTNAAEINLNVPSLGTSRRGSEVARQRRLSLIQRGRQSRTNGPAPGSEGASGDSKAQNAEAASTSRLTGAPTTADTDMSSSIEHEASGEQRSRISSDRKFSFAPRGRISQPRRSVTNNIPIPLPPLAIPLGGTPSKGPDGAFANRSRPRSTFGRASFPPAPRTSLPSQSVAGSRTQSHEDSNLTSSGPSQPARMSLAEFVKATGHEFREVPEPRDVIIRPPNPGEESDNTYKLSDIIKAMMIHYPQLDMHESSVAEMKEQVEILQTECEEMHAQADESMPDVILDWLEADEEEREMIKTATQIRKSNASLQAQATWISWRHANALKALETAQVHNEELAELDRKLESLDNALPAALAALQVEHDKLEAELEEEQAIVQEIESCDKVELEEFLAELEAQNAEVEDAAATVRQTKVYLDKLEQKEKEVQGQVDAAQAAINAANSIAKQTRVDSPEEAARLEDELRALQYLHSWRLGRMRSDLFEIKYDARMSVSVVCKNYEVGSVSIALLPNSAERRLQFPLLNDLMMPFGERALSDLGKPKNVRDIVVALDRAWGSLTRVCIELRTLSMWPLQIERYGDYGLRATARVLLKTAGGRADVTFLFTEEVLRTWPAKVFQLGFEVDVKYGTATREEVLVIISNNLGLVSLEDCYNVLAEACAELRDAYDPDRRPRTKPTT